MQDGKEVGGEGIMQMRRRGHVRWWARIRGLK